MLLRTHSMWPRFMIQHTIFLARNVWNVSQHDLPWKPIKESTLEKSNLAVTSVTNPSQWSVISKTTKEDIIRKGCSRATQGKEMFKTAVNLYNHRWRQVNDVCKSKCAWNGQLGNAMWKRVDFEWFGFIYCIKKLNLQYFQKIITEPFSTHHILLERSAQSALCPLFPCLPQRILHIYFISPQFPTQWIGHYIFHSERLLWEMRQMYNKNKSMQNPWSRSSRRPPKPEDCSMDEDF